MLNLRLFVLLAALIGLSAAEPAIPRVFIGEWTATVIAVEGDYGKWYRPGDTTDVAISRLGILRTLDGGGGTIHFLLIDKPDEKAGKRVVATRVIPGLPDAERVTITADHGVLRVLVRIKDLGRMELELEEMLPFEII